MDYELLHGLERHFLNLEELGAHDKEFNIMLKLGNGICWALKFRHAGLIYNRLDLVLADCIACDGTLTIRDVATFHHMMIGETTFDEELKHDRMKLQTSTPEIAHALKARFHGVLSTTSSAMFSHTTAPSSSSAAVGSSSSSSAAYSSSSSTAVAPSSSSAAHQPGGISSGNSSHHANNPGSSMRDYRVTSSGEAPPLKTGWLLKKRDIISGWKCRYFEVHMDRLDYFESPDDARPRGSYLLHHVDVSTVKPIRTKRKSEHYGLFLQLHAPEKTIKLASDKTGLEGRVEADAWYQVFTMIARHHKARAAGGVTSSNNVNANTGSSQLPPPPPPPPEFSNSPGGQRLTPKRVAYTPTASTENNWSTSRPTAIATTAATTSSSSKKTIGHKFARFVRRITGRKPITTSGRRSRGGGVHARSGSSSGGNTPTGALGGQTLRGKKKSLAKMNSIATGNDGIAAGGVGDGNDGTGPSVGGAVGAGKSGMARSGIRSAGDTVGATQILAYGGGILALTVALVYAWWVTKSISTKTFVTLAVLMVVLMAIFVQEFILDDDDDDEEEDEEDEEDGEYEGEEGDEAGEFTTDGEGGDRHDSFDHGDEDDHDGERRRRTAATNEIVGEDDEEEEDLDTDDEDDVHSDEEAYAAAKARPPKGAHRPPPAVPPVV